MGTTGNAKAVPPRVPPSGSKKKPFYANLWVQVLVAVAIAIALGHFSPGTAVKMKPFGDAFIRLISMIITLVVFCTIVTGIAGMQDLKKVGRVGGKALIYFEVVSTLALLIGWLVGVVVHPGAGNPRHTLQNALLGLDPNLALLPRAGLVHRLDKDTSGLLVVARTPEAHAALIAAMAARKIGREYLAVCTGVMTAGGTVEEPIGRHRTQRTRMAVRADGRPAVTRYRVVKRFRAHTLVRVELETGRTHQIRVHLAHIGFPVVGDPLYAGRRRVPAGCTPALAAELHAFPRQALHAARLKLTHPVSGRELAWEAPLPEDLQRLLGALEADGS